MTTEKPHLSHTQLDLICSCGEAYRRTYIEREKTPPGLAMLRGSAFHRAAETNMRQKIESHVDLPAKEVADIAAAAFDDSLHGGYTLTDEEHSAGPQNTIGATRDNIVGMARLHAELQAPDYQPLFVEQKVRLALPGPRDLVAVLDLADDEAHVVDFKTAAKSKSASEANVSTQLTIYAAAFHALTGEPAADVRLDTIVMNKVPKRQVLVSDRNERDFAALAARVNVVNQAIDAGNFMPANPTAWKCSAKWCQFYSTCRFVSPR